MTTDRWGCPDWLDAQAYPENADSLKTWEWGWEFVRRNPRYRKNYMALHKRGLNVNSTNHLSPEGDLLRHEAKNFLMLQFSLDDYHDPGLGYQDFETNPFYTTAGIPVSIPSKSWMLNKWDCLEKDGVEVLRSYFNWLITYMQLQGLTKPYEDEEEDRPERVQKLIAYTFDMGQPLSRQLENAARSLKEESEKMGVKFPRARFFGKIRDMWPLYLRILDADDQGAADKEIYEQILSESENDLEMYDKLAGTENPYALVADWRNAAKSTLDKVSYWL